MNAKWTEKSRPLMLNMKPFISYMLDAARLERAAHSDLSIAHSVDCVHPGKGVITLNHPTTP